MLIDQFSMTNISDLTYKVVAADEVPNFNADEFVDWAIEMVFLGHDTPSLLILAGLPQPTNYFEASSYLKKALTELDITIKTGDEAVLSYCSYFIKKIALSDNIRRNLETVYRFCQMKDYEESIYDFYLIYWAWDDFDYGNEYSPYWEDANKSTIEKTVVDRAIKWIDDNKQHYAQQGFGASRADE
ncbi:MAG: hypothetical protein EOO44_09585 [Flavobacterium sp.]|nr:MAG: hypothetical protein EOO44_09585 [Flavobacterium sp.]